MPRFGRFNAGQDSGPPSVGDQDADWKRADFIRVIQDASRPAGWRGATRFQPDNDTQQTLPKGYPEGHEEDMQYGEIPIGPGKALRTLSGAIEIIPTVTGEVLPGIEEAWKSLKNITKLPGEDVASFARRKLLTERNFKANKIIEERLGGADGTLGKFAEARRKEFSDAAQSGQDSARRGLAKVQEVQNKLYDTKNRVAKFAEDWTGESGEANIRKIFEESKQKYAAEQAAKKAATPNLPPGPDPTQKPKIEYRDWAAERKVADAERLARLQENKQKLDKVIQDRLDSAAADKLARKTFNDRQTARLHESWLRDQAEKQRLGNRSLFEKLRDTFK